MKTIHGKYLLWAVGIIVGFTIAWVFHSGIKSTKQSGLPQGAVKLLDTTNLWMGSMPTWLNNHNLLIGQEVLDTRTGQEKMLPGIRHLFQQPGPLQGQSLSMQNVVSFSPDRKWVLLTGAVPAHGRTLKESPFQPVWFAAKMDGSRLVVRPRPINEDQTTVAWEPDGKHWVEVESSFSTPDDQAHLVVYSLDTPQEQDIATNWQVLGSTLAFAPNGDGLLVSLGGGAAPVMLYRFRLGQSVTLLSSVNYALHASYANECAISPNGNRLAWLLYISHSPSQGNGVQKALAFLTASLTTYSRSVWVSRLDGSGLRQVVPAARLGSQGWSMGNLQWTPDGQRLCLDYNHALWTVPVAGVGA